MWIEILIKDDEDTSCGITPSTQLFNTDCIHSAELADNGFFIFLQGKIEFCHYSFNDIKTCKAVFDAFKLALQGQEATLEDIGFIRPLLNAKQEALHKHLLLQQTINSLTSDVG